MTAQISDMVRYADADWQLAGVDGGKLFTPADHGLQVRAASTACWRGFVCFYSLRDGALVLDGVDLALVGDMVPLFGRTLGQPRKGYDFNASYRALEHVVPFTGGLLIARNFHRELYVHMGFHPAWKYTDVVEIELDAGRVVRATDCSTKMAEIRQRLAGTDRPGTGASEAEIRGWIERAFSRKY